MTVAHDGTDYYGYSAPSKATSEYKIHMVKVKINERVRWIYLRYRLLVQDGRGRTMDLDLGGVVEEEEDGGGREREDLGIVQRFMVGTNDDEFRYTLEFV